MSKFLAAFSIALGLLATAGPAPAQPAGKVYRVGYLTSGAVENVKQRLKAFRQGLKELGYIEGKNIVIEERYANGHRERLPALAMQLASLGIDVFVTNGSRASRAADLAGKKAGRTIPVVFAQQANPVETGLVKSLARPGGNITGMSDYHADLVPKTLEILKEALPTAKRIAVFWNGRRNGRRELQALRDVAPRLGVTLLPVVYGNPDDFDHAFATIRHERPDAVNVLGYQKGKGFLKRFLAFVRENRLPTMLTNPRYVAAGALMSYGVDRLDLYRRAASYVDKILKGAKPADLPVELPTRFFLTVNLRTARALGITIPPSILLRADRVIQ